MAVATAHTGVVKTLRLAMVGFGNAGKELARILATRGRALEDGLGVRLLVTGISTLTRGAIIEPSGVDLQRVLDVLGETGRLPGADSPSAVGREAVPGEATGGGTTCEFILQCPSDVVVEVTPLNIMTAQPATSHIETALRSGKHVVTANKGPVAWHYRRLAALARENGVRLLFESVVMDGTPVFNMARHCLTGCVVAGFRGILNSTTNFILDEMNRGLSFHAALKNARDMGIAEADPSLDIEGWDAAAKTAALMNVLMGADVTPFDIEREGIGGVDESYLAGLRSSGKLLKLFCEGTRAGGRVKRAEIPADHPFAGVTGTSSVLSIETDLMGEITIVENNPGVLQTAYGLLNDLLEIAACS